ncbi:MAG: TlpA family protein disulfide reductase [Acidimicrobiia bacterium]
MTETETVPTEPEALPPRGGRLALIFVAVIVVGAGIGFAVRSAFRNAEELRQPPTLDQSLSAFPPGPNAGQPAPDFTLELFDLSTFTLSEHLANDGRPVLLYFWFPSCPPCRAEMPEINRVADTTPGVIFVGVGLPVIDTREQAAAFAEEMNVKYPIGWDETESIAAAYGVARLPQTWVIGSDGRIVRTYIGAVTEQWLRGLIWDDLGVVSEA